jgi:ribosomal protein S3
VEVIGFGARASASNQTDKLIPYIIQNMYNKEVEFNIVELNQMHLNSDIYTQAVAMKLKNRKNSLY